MKVIKRLIYVLFSFPVAALDLIYAVIAFIITGENKAGIIIDWYIDKLT